MLCFHTLLTTYQVIKSTEGVQRALYIAIRQRAASKIAKDTFFSLFFCSEITRQAVARTCLPHQSYAPSSDKISHAAGCDMGRTQTGTAYHTTRKVDCTSLLPTKLQESFPISEACISCQLSETSSTMNKITPVRRAGTLQFGYKMVQPSLDKYEQIAIIAFSTH